MAPDESSDGEYFSRGAKAHTTDRRKDSVNKWGQSPRGAKAHTTGENGTFSSLAAVGPGARHARPKTEDAGAQGVKPRAD